MKKQLIAILFLSIIPFYSSPNTKSIDTCCANPGSSVGPIGSYLFNLSNIINSINQSALDTPLNNIGTRWYNAVTNYIATTKTPCQNCAGSDQSIYCAPLSGSTNLLQQDPTQTCSVYSESSIVDACKQAVAATNIELACICNVIFKDSKAKCPYAA